MEGAVAPFTGAWIEITTVVSKNTEPPKSHPSRVRGLKFTGKWIDIGVI